MGVVNIKINSNQVNRLGLLNVWQGTELLICFLFVDFQNIGEGSAGCGWNIPVVGTYLLLGKIRWEDDLRPKS